MDKVELRKESSTKTAMGSWERGLNSVAFPSERPNPSIELRLLSGAAHDFRPENALSTMTALAAWYPRLFCALLNLLTTDHSSDVVLRQPTLEKSGACARVPSADSLVGRDDERVELTVPLFCLPPRSTFMWCYLREYEVYASIGLPLFTRGQRTHSCPCYAGLRMGSGW